MGSRKGRPKPERSGRKKGTPNKLTVDAQAKAKELGVDPFSILCWFASGDWRSLGYDSETETRYAEGGVAYEVRIITPDHRLKAAMEVLQYLLPKRKAAEGLPDHDGKVDGKANITIRWVDESDLGNAQTDAATEKI
jgi:hypothetical protein